MPPALVGVNAKGPAAAAPLVPVFTLSDWLLVCGKVVEMTLGTRLRRAGRCRPLLTKAGRCTVCGRPSLFLVTDLKGIRENAWCIGCGSSARNRHVAKCVVEALSGFGVARFTDLATTQSLSIYNMSAQGCFARVWGRRPHITYSEYFDDAPSGECREGILCQNVEQLSFDDSSFDLVVSEDVFEHVRDYRKGFWEVRRVLKLGGRHIFSVPIGLSHPTFPRFGAEQGKEVPILPLEYHGDPSRGQIPVRTSFGYDLLGFLESLGFEARLEMPRYEEACRFGTFDCATFVTSKA